MKFTIDELEIIFPYEYIYPEQYAYMVELKRVMDGQGHGLLEMPSGTGKTVTILSFFTSYQHAYPGKRKLIYCSRTVPEINKALQELKFIVQYRESYYSNIQKEDLAKIRNDFLAIGLSSRKNLCIHPTVSKERYGKAVDARCHEMTTSYRREQAKYDSSIRTCDFYEKLYNKIAQTTETGESILPPGVYTLDDIKAFGVEQQICPYFLSRHALSSANILIYSYWYLLDPKISEIVSRQLDSSSIVVFDEAHNIDNVALEVLSVDLTREDLDRASRSCDRLKLKVEAIKAHDTARLKQEYNRLLEGLRQKNISNMVGETLVSNPVIPTDVIEEAIPGNIRNADHFLALLKRLVEYLKVQLKGMNTTTETPASFLLGMQHSTLIDRKPLKFTSERLASLVRTLELTEIDELSSLIKTAHFATLLATYARGFAVLFEPFSSELQLYPVLHLVCMDPAIVMGAIFSRFDNVLITSGTLSPLEMYPKILAFSPKLSVSLSMSMARQSFLPLVIARGADQVVLSTRFEGRHDLSLIRSYGQLLVEIVKITPDGVVLFFPSYYYMKAVIGHWKDMGILNELLSYKLVFIETTDSDETIRALKAYKLACDAGRGSLLLSVARGKISEGVDFEGHYGRAVLLFGVPYQYTESLLLRAKLEYLRETYGIRESDWLTFDAMRQAAQCLGRVIRGKSDYGLMILADKRFSRIDKRSKFPTWIQVNISDANINLSTDMAVALTKDFFKQMGQPCSIKDQLGVSLWTLEHLQEHQRKEALQR